LAAVLLIPLLRVAFVKRADVLHSKHCWQRHRGGELRTIAITAVLILVAVKRDDAELTLNPEPNALAHFAAAAASCSCSWWLFSKNPKHSQVHKSGTPSPSHVAAATTGSLSPNPQGHELPNKHDLDLAQERVLDGARL